MNRRGNPVRRGLAATLVLLTLGLSVTVPVMERGTVSAGDAVESHHDPARCTQHHDHRVCTQVGANLSLTSGESEHRLPHVVVHTAPVTAIRTWSGAASLEGPPSRAPPLA